MDVIKVMVEVLIFTSVIGIIATSVISPNENITGGARTLYGLITLFIVVGFIIYLTKSAKLKKN